MPASWGTLCYGRAGRGSPLLVLHSLALSHRMWEPVVAEFTSSHDVIAVDFRGHGGSRWDGSPFSIEDLASDLGQLLHALDISRCDVLGMSMGGSVAAAFAASSPSRVRRLVLADTTAWYGPDARSAWEKRAKTAATAREAQVAFQTERWFSEQFRREHPSVVSLMVEIFLATSPHAHQHACRALGSLDARRLLAAVTAPALVVTGQDDYATPPSMGQALAEAIADATAEVWPGLRHFAILESPQLRERVLAYLADIGAHRAGHREE